MSSVLRGKGGKVEGQGGATLYRWVFSDRPAESGGRAGAWRGDPSSFTGGSRLVIFEGTGLNLYS